MATQSTLNSKNGLNEITLFPDEAGGMGRLL